MNEKRWKEEKRGRKGREDEDRRWDKEWWRLEGERKQVEVKEKMFVVEYS